MQSTIDTLHTEIEKTQTYLARVRDRDARATNSADEPNELQIPGDRA
jgi:hypothetical protein